MTRRAALGLAASALALGACGVLPAPPGELDTDFVPNVTPSPAASSQVGADGFTLQEHYSVRVRVATCGGWATGSGWVLSANQVITNQHVVDDATSIEITTYDGREYPVTTSQIAPTADLALLTLDPVFTEWATWEVRQPEPGDEISIIGYPEGQALHTSTGRFVTMTEDTVGGTGEMVMDMRASIKHGNSGSPLYDSNGVVVGTVYAGDDFNDALAWPNDYLADLLDGTESWKPNKASC